MEDVLLPSLNEPRGLPRLEAMYGRWIDRISLEIASGCIYVSGAVEYDDRPGPIRDELVGMIRSWQAELVRAIKQAIEVGHLRADTDPLQLIFVIQGLVLSVHFNASTHARQGQRHPGPRRVHPTDQCPPSACAEPHPASATQSESLKENLPHGTIHCPPT